MSKHSIDCFECNRTISGEICYSNDIPAKPLCETCFDDGYCKCGRKVFENGKCIDCLSEHELKKDAKDE